MNDIENILVEKAKKGDKTAFERIVIMFQDRVYSTAYRMSKNEHDAFDISQEVFIKLYKSIRKFNSEASLSTYIFRITSNVCIDFYRKNKNRLSEQSLYCENDGEEYEMPLASACVTPLDDVEMRERMATLEQGIGLLSDDHRKMIILRDIEGFSYREISEITGYKEATVKTKILRAREKLRVFLERSGNFSEYCESKNS